MGLGGFWTGRIHTEGTIWGVRRDNKRRAEGAPSKHCNFLRSRHREKKKGQRQKTGTGPARRREQLLVDWARGGGGEAVSHRPWETRKRRVGTGKRKKDLTKRMIKNRLSSPQGNREKRHETLKEPAGKKEDDLQKKKKKTGGRPAIGVLGAYSRKRRKICNSALNIKVKKKIEENFAGATHGKGKEKEGQVRLMTRDSKSGGRSLLI